MLNARWKGNAPAPAGTRTPERLIPAGQIRSFRVTTLNPDTQLIELTPA